MVSPMRLMLKIIKRPAGTGSGELDIWFWSIGITIFLMARNFRLDLLIMPDKSKRANHLGLQIAHSEHRDIRSTNYVPSPFVKDRMLLYPVSRPTARAERACGPVPVPIPDGLADAQVLCRRL